MTRTFLSIQKITHQITWVKLQRKKLEKSSKFENNEIIVIYSFKCFLLLVLLSSEVNINENSISKTKF